MPHLRAVVDPAPLVRRRGGSDDVLVIDREPEQEDEHVLTAPTTDPATGAAL